MDDLGYSDIDEDFREMSDERARLKILDCGTPPTAKEIEMSQETFDALMRDGGRVEMVPGVWISVEIARTKHMREVS